MMKSEMTQSNHTSATAAETVDTRSIDIDMDILKKERSQDMPESPSSTSRTFSEKWTGLNDSHNKEGSSSNIKIEQESGEMETITPDATSSADQQPRRQFTRRNSNGSTCSQGSTGSSGSKSSASKRKGGVTKRRSWKKPKDKPKRPLSAYNIFFKHTRSRIVEGLSEEGTTEETIASIEGIVANSTETRRHRKTHGQISFGDLARTIADKWKTIDKNQRALFDHYAALDMKRYRRDVSIWKAKKEAEALAGSNNNANDNNSTSRRPSSVSLEVSASSDCTAGSFNYLTDSQITVGAGDNYDQWNTPQHRALSSSFNSIDSEEDFGLEPLPIADIHESQSNMVGRSVPSFIENSSNGMNPNNNMMPSDNNLGMDASNAWEMTNNNNNNNNLQNKKLQDIWMKNRQLEQSINKLKQELSATSFSLGNNTNNNSMNNNTHINGNNHQDSSPDSSKLMMPPFPVGPSIDRMQQLHRRRLLMGDILPPLGNGPNQQGEQGMNGNNNSNHSNFEVVEDALAVGDDMALEPFDMNPVPFEEVFNATGAQANMKKKELITNLGHLDFLGNGGSC